MQNTPPKYHAAWKAGYRPLNLSDSQVTYLQYFSNVLFSAALVINVHRFESKYPGKKSPPQRETPVGADRDEDDYYAADRRGSRDTRGRSGGGDVYEEEERRRRQQRGRRARGGVADEYNNRSDGYFDEGEDSYEY